jgi:hypothetical protein
MADLYIFLLFGMLTISPVITFFNLLLLSRLKTLFVYPHYQIFSSFIYLVTLVAAAIYCYALFYVFRAFSEDGWLLLMTFFFNWLAVSLLLWPLIFILLTLTLLRSQKAVIVHYAVFAFLGLIASWIVYSIAAG